MNIVGLFNMQYTWQLKQWSIQFINQKLYYKKLSIEKRYKQNKTLFKMCATKVLFFKLFLSISKKYFQKCVELGLPNFEITKQGHIFECQMIF